MGTYILLGLVAMLAGAALIVASRTKRPAAPPPPQPEPEPEDDRPAPLASMPPTPSRERIRTGVLSLHDIRSDDELAAAGDELVERQREKPRG